MLIFSIFKVLHIIAGFTALLVFWIPVVTKKGGKAHVRSGWVYVWAMGAVAISALVMGIWRIGFDPQKTGESVAFAWFLIFIAILSSATAWYGIRVLRYKNRKAAHRHAIDLLFPALLLLSGGAMSLYGASIGFTLLTWFPFIGIFLGASQLWYWLRAPGRKLHWWFEHLGGMLGCCIATITAFTVFGAPRLLGLSSVHPLVWFMPTIVLVPCIIGFSRYYQKKFNQSKSV
ncbi:hypothetical protein [Brevibacillus parabrevis]|jgi:hypothetical protein|uniref:DUF2306 domain-containing protein n=1 Tax=Brevibacillus parabrevis TaxID=54914 RepID=A0A4Y3PVC7_BREPA|nr:hypothetical protein [Brevibacillus parabrevis]KZE47160.1 hypothetical protein AV540_20400 [Brevibacillus parabrevis]MED1725090.1 DUF2306 domain-containing protein [Brevibacillus parabrevis]MED2253371.1 DUF2306 domain-containing protein [Brevibacillus parabrevis]RNB95153.1 DUF2306 domain-containing protein [Brevibacillus parabrevis]WDV94250.1 DUF2306 domain-containing protein [Brevibacillus parabrevis]